MTRVRLIFPHQLFEAHYDAPTDTHFVLVEDDLYFRQYPFHVQKLVMHRASMRLFEAVLQEKGFATTYIETDANTASMDALKHALADATEVSYVDVVDDWLERRLRTLSKELGVSFERLESPGFLTSAAQIDEYFSHNPKRMQSFYMWQRRRLDILVEGSEPVGGQWSFDAENRKRLPKHIELPEAYTYTKHAALEDAQAWAKQAFLNNPGNADTFFYPLTHDEARMQLQIFLRERLANFGPYEDAIAREPSWLFHSVLSAPLNIGLITPQEVIDETMAYAQNHDVPLQSLEGFIRQIIGWREYMRATYVQFGPAMRTKNVLNMQRQLPDSWWDGSTGIEPIDQTIQKVLNTAYAHHIERLMVLGNSALLLRIHPDEVYRWFMSLFIDAYDWVMVSNVYAMSQFAAGELITTKPYISGSNYILKMSDYSKGAWCDDWDALYWQFIDDYRAVFMRNPRSSMMVKLYERMHDEKRSRLAERAAQLLQD